MLKCCARDSSEKPGVPFSARGFVVDSPAGCSLRKPDAPEVIKKACKNTGL
ncbi:MAG TPA: hypothetical protein VF677_13850 [Flavobacterium sp.]